jgi:transposase
MFHGHNKRTMGTDKGIYSAAQSTARKIRQATTGFTPDTQWYSVDTAYRRAVERPAGSVSAQKHLPSALPDVEQIRCLCKDTHGTGAGFERPRPNKHKRGLHRRDFCSCEKRGDGVGKTKKGKGTKIMGLADAFGLPIAVSTSSASPHEITLVENTLDACFLENVPEKIVGDMAYDSDPLDNRLANERGVELIAPHKTNRVKPATQDGRPFRRYRKRYKIERLFAWLQNFRRLVVRYEYHLQNFLAMVQLGCIVILLRRVLG